jgi:hypothetical protein
MGNEYSTIPEEKKEVKQFTEEQINKYNTNSFIVQCDNSFVVFIPFGILKLKIKSFEINPLGSIDDMFVVEKEALDFIDNKLIPRLHELFTFEDK